MRVLWLLAKIVLFMLLFLVWTAICLVGAAYVFVWAASHHMFIT